MNKLDVGLILLGIAVLLARTLGRASIKRFRG